MKNPPNTEFLNKFDQSIQLIQCKMQKNSTLSQKDISQLLQKYVFEQKTLDQLITAKIQQNCNLNRSSIIHKLNKLIKQFILDLEKGLWMAQKITELLFYDHDSDVMYESFVFGLKHIIVDGIKNEFMQLYRNCLLNSIQIIWQIEYTFIHTDKKMQVYQSFVNYAKKHDLFTKVRLNQTDPTQGSSPYQNINRVFPQRDLELILKKFKQSNQNVLKTYWELKKLHLNSPQYEHQREFVYRFDNLLLIGVYYVYKLICKESEVQSEAWTDFKDRNFRVVDFMAHLDKILRIAIRKDPSENEIRKGFLPSPKIAPKSKSILTKHLLPIGLSPTKYCSSANRNLSFESIKKSKKRYPTMILYFFMNKYMYWNTQQLVNHG